MASQNISTAVMNRRSEPSDSLDDFPTPPWATRAFIHHILRVYIHKTDTVLEPCCNRGYMANPLREYFDDVFCSDVEDYGYEHMDAKCDFLFPDQLEAHYPKRANFVFANPPFKCIDEFIYRALELASCGVFIFARTSLLEGCERYHRLYRDNPPKIFAQYAERVILHKGRLLDPNDTYWHIDPDPQKTGYRRPSSATSYAWFGWGDRLPEMRPHWIPPCRKEFERGGDYPGNPKAPVDLVGTMFEGLAN
ncbi:methyltransferase [Lentilitoribacter sp. EG35]|uniref:methyltransferase n=1 Tax=Lentilitoribacter sp. EG35 TaxID=3234192 RepID=UPI003460E3FD